jgi:FG-GAP repeat
MRLIVLVLMAGLLSVVEVVDPSHPAAGSGGGPRAIVRASGPDFNGDGFGDLAIGVPGETLGSSIFSAGAVNVLYGSIAGLLPTGIPDQVWTQNTSGVAETAEDGDGFGSTLATGDFNGDGYGDLAIGTPEEDLAVGGEGVVQILHGSRSGLATTIPDQLWSQDSTGIKDTAEVDDGFGSALTTGDFDGDGYGDLAVGVPYEDNNVATNFGATNVLYGSPSGLTDTGDQFWSQDSADVNGVIEDSDLHHRRERGGGELRRIRLRPGRR